MLSEVSLLCFLADLRMHLACFEGHIPDGISFISLESFFFYFRNILPDRCNQISTLMAVLHPYIPVIISKKSFGNLVSSYVGGDLRKLEALEQSLAARSKMFFVNSAMKKCDEQWENILDICCQIRNYKEQALSAQQI